MNEPNTAIKTALRNSLSLFVVNRSASLKAVSLAAVLVTPIVRTIALLTALSLLAVPSTAQTTSASTINDREPNRQITLNAEGSFPAHYDDAVEPYQIAVLGLHDSELAPVRPTVLDALHHSLPLQGWRVLSLAPGKTTSKKISRIRVGATYLEDTKSASVALISGTEHIEQAIQIAIERQVFVSGLVLWQVEASNLDWQKMDALKDSRISLLDVAPAQLDKRARLQRKHQFALAGFVDDYRQINLSDSTPADSAAKRVRRWLEDEFQK